MIGDIGTVMYWILVIVLAILALGIVGAIVGGIGSMVVEAIERASARRHAPPPHAPPPSLTPEQKEIEERRRLADKLRRIVDTGGRES